MNKKEKYDMKPIVATMDSALKKLTNKTIPKIKICKTLNCNKPVVINLQTGIPFSKWCPNCTLKRKYKGSSLERAHKHPKLPKKRTERQRAMDRADEWFSRFVRIKHSILTVGIICCRCYTCQKLYIIKKLDCGHYINRPHHTVRWDINNARPQCKQCNYYRSGEHHKFEQNLIREIGQKVVDELKQKANQIANYSVEDIREIAKEFRVNARLKEKRIGVKVWN